MGGRKEPATSNTAGASSWWGLFTQCGGTPPDDGRLCRPVAALGGVGFVKQGGGVKGGLGNGTAPAAMVVGEAGACAGGADPNNIKEGGRPCLILPHQPGGQPIQTTSRRGVDHVSFFLINQGGAQDSQKFLETEE